MKNFRFGKMMVAVAAAFMLLGMSSCRINANGNNSIDGGNVSYSAADLKSKTFSKVNVNVVADVFYTQNNDDKCGVKLDFSAIDDEKLASTLKEKVKVLYRDGGVEIVQDGKISGIGNMNSGHRLKIYITSSDIIKITMGGVGSFHADSINSDTLEIDNEGVGSVYVKSVLANRCEVDNEGVGSVSIDAMKGDYVKVDNEGVGSVKVGKFEGGKVYIDNEGVGKVVMDVNCDYVKAVLEGVGSVRLSGVTRQLDERRDGIGSVKKKDLKILE